MKEPVLARLREIIAELFDVDLHSVSPETKTQDIPAWDSVGHFSLCGALEKSFEIRFDVGRWREMTVTTT